MSIDASWSKLLTSDLGEYVMDRMDTTPSLTYHNGNHVRRMYQHAKTWNIPYDATLDAAILFHDAVYDSQPEKEVRSAELVVEVKNAIPHWFDGLDVFEINKLILTTIDHKIKPNVSSMLIKLDLADLTDKEQTTVNFKNILAESMELYNINDFKAAIGTIEFMNNFSKTIQHNADVDHQSKAFDGDGAEFWYAVLNGVEHTITLAQDVVVTFKNKHGLK